MRLYVGMDSSNKERCLAFAQGSAFSLLVNWLVQSHIRRLDDENRNGPWNDANSRHLTLLIVREDVIEMSHLSSCSYTCVLNHRSGTRYTPTYLNRHEPRRNSNCRNWGIHSVRALEIWYCYVNTVEDTVRSNMNIIFMDMCVRILMYEQYSVQLISWRAVRQQ
jgi:transposase